MDWLLVAIGAYLFLAVANLLDKFLVDNVLKNSKAYAFIVCIMGLVVLVVAPWFLEWPGFSWFLFNIVTGFFFAVALWMLYEALKRGEAARTLVFIGGLTPIFTIVMSIVFFKETYTINQWIGMGFLLSGVLVIAFISKPVSILTKYLTLLGLKRVVNNKSLQVAIVSAFFYAIFFIASKHTYNNQGFISAFLWNRLGAGLFVLVFLIRKKDREAIYSLFKKSSPSKNKLLVISNQVLGSSGFVLQNYAISLGPVAIVNAMQGIQYAFLVVITSILAVVAPKLLKEKFSWPVILKKAFAILLVGVGLYFITV